MVFPEDEADCVGEDPYMLADIKEEPTEHVKEEPTEPSPAAEEAPPPPQPEVSPQAAYAAAITLGLDLQAMLRLPQPQWEAALRQ